MSAARAHRRELAAVALALLLPIPLLAASGLHLPLPAAVERGLASLTPGGDFDTAVVEAAPARPEPAPASTPTGDGDPTAPRVVHATSSTAIPPVADSGSAPTGERSEPTRGGTDVAPPETGDSPQGGGGAADDEGGDAEDGPEEDGLEPLAGVAAASAGVESSLTVGVDAAGVAAEVAVDDESVQVVVPGATIEVGVPVPDLPVPPPSLGLP